MPSFRLPNPVILPGSSANNPILLDNNSIEFDDLMIGYLFKLRRLVNDESAESEMNQEFVDYFNELMDVDKDVLGDEVPSD